MASPDPTPSPEPTPEAAPVTGAVAGNEDAATVAPHNFDVQKDLHRRIRNDPDYDDWEYGTEPLPHEAWPAPASGESGQA